MRVPRSDQSDCPSPFAHRPDPKSEAKSKSLLEPHANNTYHILLRNSATLIRPSNLAKTSQRPQTSMRCQMLFHFHSVLKVTITHNTKPSKRAGALRDREPGRASASFLKLLWLCSPSIKNNSTINGCFHYHSVLKLTITCNPQSELARCATGGPGERQRASLSCCDYAYLPSRRTVLSTE